jgi:predicted GNAT family acetyltransferase
MDLQVTHDEQHQRYELLVDGQPTGVAEYHTVGDTRVFFHTEIDRAQRGRGFGDALVRGALDDTRATGGHVTPQCWFVAQYIDEHPEYGDLVAA